jgi:hypothetical protein
MTFLDVFCRFKSLDAAADLPKLSFCQAQTYLSFLSLHLTPTYSPDLQESDHFTKNTLDEPFYSCEVNLGSCLLTFNHSLRRDSVPLSTLTLVNSFTVCLCQPLLLAPGRHIPSIGRSHITWPRGTCSNFPSSRTRPSDLVCALPDHFPTTLTFLTYLPSVDL